MARWLGIYLDLPSPFSLRRPDPSWCATIAAYDPELVIYPSQKDFVYRLARKAKHSGGFNRDTFAKLPNLHPDTQVCLEHGLVAVTTIPVKAIDAPAANIVDQLYGRDLWRQGGADAVADRLDEGDAEREAAVDRKNEDELRVRARAMRNGYLYRTGARVSLVSPRRQAAAASDANPEPVIVTG